MADEGEGKKSGKKRVRTKGLQKKLLEQIEFYFGNANLQKDRFLQQKMKEHPDGYVAIETVASFNKMKTLTSDISIVVQVMKKSDILELSLDEKWVRRSTPLPSVNDADSRTIYVEHLPPNSDHDTVRKLFKVFGNICYVSLPRHKSSGIIKGFSFIEFSTVDEAAACLEYFKCGTKPVTPSSASKSFPDKSISIMDVSVEGGERGREVGEGEGEGEGGGKCEGEGEGGGKGEGEGEGGRRGEGEGEGGKVGGEVVVKEEEVEGETVEDKERDVDSTIEETKTRKRRRTEDIAEDSRGHLEEAKQTVPLAKKSKRDDAEADKEEAKPLDVEKESSSSAEPCTVKSTDSVEGKSSVDETQSRKRKRTDEAGEGEEGAGGRGTNKSVRLDLQSLEKGAQGMNGCSGDDEGRLLRLDSQTSETGDDTEVVAGQKKVKKKNRQHKKRDWEAALKTLQLRVMTKKEWLEMRDIFRNLQKEKVKEMKQELKERERGRERTEKGFVSQCLVKVEGVGRMEGDQVATIEKVQEICSKYGVVAYTDIKEGESEGYIRYANSGCVKSLVDTETSSLVKFMAVSDEDERAYYLKTVASRKQLAVSNRTKKKRNIRGQDKIISRALQHRSHQATEPSIPPDIPAATHIRFSDSEEES